MVFGVATVDSLKVCFSELDSDRLSMSTRSSFAGEPTARVACGATPQSSWWKAGGRLKGARWGGAFGETRLAVTSATGHSFVVQTFTREQEEPEASHAIEQLVSELSTWQELWHPNLASIIGHSLADHHLHVFFEWVSYDSIASLLQEFGPLPAHLLQKSTHGALQGIGYLHSHKVAHGNIRGATMLVKQEFGIKLTDTSGVSGCALAAAAAFATVDPELLPWMAPEVVQGKLGDGLKADAWSLGCTVLEMATAGSPWGREAEPESVRSVLLGQPVPGMSSLPPLSCELPMEGSSFVRMCLQRSIAARAGVQELLSHPYAAEEEALLEGRN